MDARETEDDIPYTSLFAASPSCQALRINSKHHWSDSELKALATEAGKVGPCISVAMSGDVFASFIEETFPANGIFGKRKSVFGPSHFYNRNSPTDPYVFEGYNNFGQKRVLISVKSEVDRNAVYSIAAEIGIKELR